MDMSHAASCTRKRLQVLKGILTQLKGNRIACVGSRIKTAKVNSYIDTSSDDILTAATSKNNVKPFHEDNINLNRRNILIKKNDESIYIVDPYLCTTLEEKLKSRLGSICRQAIYLKYDYATDTFTETKRTGIKVEGRQNIAIDNSDDSKERVELQIRPLCLTCKGKTLECYTCIHHHSECDKVCSKNAYSLIDVRYNIPLISERSNNHQHVLGGSERSASNYQLQYSIRYPLFCEYPTRLSTFRNWRHYLAPTTLAENGFFYQGIGDTVICHFCGVALMHWDPDDDALLEHIRYSPNCGYLVKSLGARTIQQYLGQSNDCVTTGAYNIAETQNLRSSAEVLTESSRTPRNPSYQSLSVRVATFSTFPNYNDINIQDLANAGFYYTGVDDIVRCYCCDLGLKEWEFGDDPYMEHAKYLPECNHLMTVKDKQFIVHVQRNYDQNLEEVKVSSIPIENSGTVRGAEERNHMRHNIENGTTLHMERGTEKQSNVIDVLDTPAVESVLESGYSKEVVMAAIRKLKNKGQSFSTAMQIFEVIFHAEESGIDLITQDFINLDLQKTKVVNGSKDDESIQLLAENHRLKSIMICKQCQRRERTMLFLPCCHRNLCEICANETDLCPECQQQIKQKVKTVYNFPEYMVFSLGDFEILSSAYPLKHAQSSSSGGHFYPVFSCRGFDDDNSIYGANVLAIVTMQMSPVGKMSTFRNKTLDLEGWNRETEEYNICLEHSCC